MIIFTEEEEIALIRHSKKLAGAEMNIYYCILGLQQFGFHDAHVISWLTLNYWHVEVGRDGEWRLA